MWRTVVLILAALALVAVTPRAAAAQATSRDGGLKAYIEARQALEQKDPELRRALRQPSGDLKPLKERIASGLGGGPLDADAFIVWHEQVRSSAALREQVEKELQKPAAAAASSPSGASGAARGETGPATGTAAPAGAPRTGEGAGASTGGAGAPTTNQSGIATPPPASGAPGPAPAGAGGQAPMGAGGPPPAAPAAPATSPK
jgi:hypothetical protein